MGFKQKSSVSNLFGSPAKNLKSGGKMISSDKGSSNYMKEDPGSPAKALKPEIKNFFSRVGSSIADALGNKEFLKNKQAYENDKKSQNLKTVSATATPSYSDSLYGRGGRGGSKSTGSDDGGKPVKPTPTTTSAGPVPTVKPKKVVPKSTTKDNTPPAVTGSDAVKLAKIKANKKNNSAPPEALTGSDAVKVAKINKKKKASEPKETSRKEIRSAKTTAKQAGKSKQEIRLAKTKAKAKNARIETTSKETAAQGGKKAQEKRAKTIRLEKRAKRIEGRIAKRKAKK